MRKHAQFLTLVLGMVFILLTVSYLHGKIERQPGMAGTNAVYGWFSGLTSDVKMMDVQESRVQSLRDQCHRFEDDELDVRDVNTSRLDHIIVDDRYKFMYCFVPKIACTTLRRIFLVLTGKVNTTTLMKSDRFTIYTAFYKHFSFLNTYSIADVKHRIQTYRKVIFVREPFERLLSAFRDKFSKTTPELQFKRNFGRKIVKMFRPNASKSSLMNGDDVTFPEFVDYLLAVHSKGVTFDHHWKTVNDLCLPCHVKYDFIGRYESIESDVEKLLKDLSVDHLVQFPKRETYYKKEGSTHVLSNFLRNLTTAQITGLQEVYAMDQKLFSYDTPN